MKSEKLANKLTALKAELKEARHAEVKALRQAARRNITRAARKAGLLRLIGDGGVAPEVLETEFRAVAERLRSGAPATAPVVESAAAEQPPTADLEAEHKSFWKR